MKNKITKNCLNCKKTFLALISECNRGGGKYCSTNCYQKSIIGRSLSKETKDKISLTRIGDKNWSKRPDVREKIRQSLLGRDLGGFRRNCISCSKPFKCSPSDKTVNCSKECSSKYFSQFTGEKNGNWKGGLTPIHLMERRGLKYKQWREAVFNRDNFTCKYCEKRGYKLNADHIKPFSLYPQLRFDVNNGQTLCVDCHRIKTKTDWRIIKSFSVAV